MRTRTEMDTPRAAPNARPAADCLQRRSRCRQRRCRTVPGSRRRIMPRLPRPRPAPHQRAGDTRRGHRAEPLPRVWGGPCGRRAEWCNPARYRAPAPWGLSTSCFPLPAICATKGTKGAPVP